MILRKKGFTLIEMLVVIMIIAILAAALFPAIAAAIAQAKSTAVKNKGRGIWTSVLSANAEREPLGMINVWPTTGYANSTDYFKFLMGYASAAWGPAICEDLKYATLTGPGMPSAASLTAFASANNAWCIAAPVSSNNVSEDAFIYTRNIVFAGVTYAAGVVVSCANVSGLTVDATVLGGWNLNRGVYVTYGGACIDRRDKYMSVDANNNQTNNLVSSTNTVKIYNP